MDASVSDQLMSFVNREFSFPTGNAWLEDNKMKVYVRKGFHVVPCYGERQGLICCLDIASVEVFDKGKGAFTTFLDEAERLNPWDAVFVENVMNERLGLFLKRKGFKSAGESYFKMKG